MDRKNAYSVNVTNGAKMLPEVKPQVRRVGESLGLSTLTNADEERRRLVERGDGKFFELFKTLPPAPV